MQLTKMLAIGTLVGMAYAAVQGTAYTFAWFQTLHADYVETKIETYETRVESTSDNIDNKSSRIFAYDRKVDRGETLDADEKARLRTLKNDRDRLQKRVVKQETQLEKWEDKLE
jgi:hypothetical protein